MIFPQGRRLNQFLQVVADDGEYGGLFCDVGSGSIASLSRQTRAQERHLSPPTNGRASFRFEFAHERSFVSGEHLSFDVVDAKITGESVRRFVPVSREEDDPVLHRTQGGKRIARRRFGAFLQREESRQSSVHANVDMSSRYGGCRPNVGAIDRLFLHVGAGADNYRFAIHDSKALPD
jgi:hypothetical protein